MFRLNWTYNELILFYFLISLFYKYSSRTLHKHAKITNRTDPLDFHLDLYLYPINKWHQDNFLIWNYLPKLDMVERGTKKVGENISRKQDNKHPCSQWHHFLWYWDGTNQGKSSFYLLISTNTTFACDIVLIQTSQLCDPQGWIPL